MACEYLCVCVCVCVFICLQGISTGVYHGAVLTNCEKSQDAVQAAGRVSGDLTFPIPYTPELHFKGFNSAVADMKNSVMVRMEGGLL